MAAMPLSMDISPTPTNPAPSFPQFLQLFIMIQYGSPPRANPHPMSFVACCPSPGSSRSFLATLYTPSPSYA